MIIVPRFTDKLIKVPVAKHGIGGQFRLQLYNENGGLAHDTGWFDNLIVDNGIAIAGGGSWDNYFYIGSGTTAPVVGDTSMETLLAASNISQGSTVNNSPAGPNYEYYSTKVRRFAAGVGTGTVNEVGVGANTAGTNLFARHLVTPGIVKADNQVLDVSYRFSVFPPIIDANGTADFDGLTYDTVVRGFQYLTPRDTFKAISYGSASILEWRTYDGDLCTVEQSAPLGSPANSSAAATASTLTSGAGFKSWEYFYDLNYGNAPLGVRTARTPTTGHPYQCQFNRQGGGGERIPKTNTDVLYLRWRIAWDRR